MTCARHPVEPVPDWCMDCHPERYGLTLSVPPPEKPPVLHLLTPSVDGPTRIDPEKQFAVEATREASIKQADDAQMAEWRRHADEKIEEAARAFPEFTSEQVWEMGLEKPMTGSSDGDALGPAMRRAKDRGIIEWTGRLEQSTNRPQRHNNPKRIWRSLIY